MHKKIKSLELWWFKLGTVPANPVVVNWLLVVAVLVLSAVVLYRCT